jgi:hypothetical protein
VSIVNLVLLIIFIFACLGVVGSFCVICVGDLDEKEEFKCVITFAASMSVVIILSVIGIVHLITKYQKNKDTTLSINAYEITNISRERVGLRDTSERLILYADDIKYVVALEKANVRIGSENKAKVRIDGNEDTELLEIIITGEVAERLGYELEEVNA